MSLKRTAKRSLSSATFLASFFVLHKVGNQKKTAKRSPWPLIWLATKKDGKKVMELRNLFGILLVIHKVGNQKRTAKKVAVPSNLVANQKKTPERRQGHFGRQKVA